MVSERRLALEAVRLKSRLLSSSLRLRYILLIILEWHSSISNFKSVLSKEKKEGHERG